MYPGPLFSGGPSSLEPLPEGTPPNGRERRFRLLTVLGFVLAVIVGWGLLYLTGNLTAQSPAPQSSSER